MSEMVEIRWHGRGGQGAKTAAFLLAESLIDQGKYAQGFPDYGPERMGAPIRGYNRISDTAVRFHCDVRTPDIVVVLDPTLIGVDDVTAGLAQDGVVIVNSPLPPEDIRQKLQMKGRKVYTIDATGIALEEIGRPIPNLPMIGSLLKVKGLSEIDSMERIVAKKFEGKFTKQVVDGNMRAMRKGYEQIRGEK